MLRSICSVANYSSFVFPFPYDNTSGTAKKHAWEILAEHGALAPEFAAL